MTLSLLMKKLFKKELSTQKGFMALRTRRHIIIKPRFFTQVPGFLNGHGLSSTDKLVYGVIYTIINTNGQCFKSNAQIAEDTEIATKSAANSITKLKKKGFITTERVYKEGTQKVEKRFIKLINDFETANEPVPKYGNTHSQIREDPLPKYGKGSKSLSRLLSKATTTAAENSSVYQMYENNIGMLPPIVRESIDMWIDDLNADVVSEAIKRAAENHKTWRYAEGILRSWIKRNITTIEQIRADDVSFTNANQLKKKPAKKPSQSFKPGDYSREKELADRGINPL